MTVHYAINYTVKTKPYTTQSCINNVNPVNIPIQQYKHVKRLGHDDLSNIIITDIIMIEEKVCKKSMETL